MDDIAAYKEMVRRAILCGGLVGSPTVRVGLDRGSDEFRAIRDVAWELRVPFEVNASETNPKLFEVLRRP